MSNRPKTGDPLLDEVNEARQRIFARCDHDPEKIFAWFLEYQKQHEDRLISRHQKTPPGKSAA